MQKSLFKPWIGSKFIDEGLYGLKLLFLGEAHYGKAGEEHENTTIDTVRYYSRHKHRYFTTTAKIGLLKGAGDYLNADSKIDFYERIAFCNLVQEFVAETAGIRPTKEMWESSRQSILPIIEELKPDLVIVLGADLNDHLPKLPSSVKTCKVNHPSMAFSYSKWLPAVREALLGVGAALPQDK